jgi:hypothetical protein
MWANRDLGEERARSHLVRRIAPEIRAQKPVKKACTVWRRLGVIRKVNILQRVYSVDEVRITSSSQPQVPL